MKNFKIKMYGGIIILLSFVLFACQEESLKVDDSPVVSVNAQTRAVTPYYFDWENADWMPTPPGQSQIPSPWVGQGSLVSIYGLDVINDRKASDGWELMYSSFNPNAPGPLVNPYFILYNKYRGLMRIFLYTTTQFYAPSSYLQDGISIISNYNTSLLNFVGKSVVNAAETPTKSYSQIQPRPTDGSYPLGSNKWYMMQYELAYDPNLVNIPYSQIQLNWSLSSFNVTKVNLAGGVNGNINGTIGSASSTSSNIISQLKATGKGIGKGILTGAGQAIIKNNTTNETTGENTLGLPKNIFKALSTGINSAMNAAAGNIPGAIVNLLSGIFGGSSSGPTAASFKLDAEISLEGSSTNAGSFPSTPISFWVPGTNIASNAVGYIPLYNKSLGVINLKANAPKISPTIEEGHTWVGPDPYDNSINECTYMYTVFPKSIDYSRYLIINPEVLKIATIEIMNQDLYVKYEQSGGGNGNKTYIEFNPSYIYWERWYPRPEFTVDPPQEPDIIEMGVRFIIKVKPKNGAPTSTIYKTFLIN